MEVSNDILFEIFSRLPAKAIYKFTSTNKLFLEFPEETYFALKQSQNALLRDETCFFIQPGTSQRHHGGIELHPLPGEELSSGVSIDALRFLSKSFRILDSSNGLILCRATVENQVKLCIGNPATQSWLPIPAPEYIKGKSDADLTIGLECDSDDYMVFLFHWNSDDWTSDMACSVYQSKEGVWKTREEKFFTGGRNLRLGMPVHYNGAIHYISDCFSYFIRNSRYFRPYIVSYNFKSGKSTMLRVPKEARRGSHDPTCNMEIFKWGKVTSSNQSICLVRLRKNVFTVWVLTDYESSTWRRILKVRVKAMGMMENDPIIIGFKVINGDLLLLATKKKVYGYDLSNEKKPRIVEISEHGSESMVLFTSYSATLRSCG